jgi:hypothetical protein
LNYIKMYILQQKQSNLNIELDALYFQKWN